MATRHGKEGKVKLASNAVTEVRRISITEQVETADATAMGDTWKSHHSGIPEWSGSVECWLDPADATGQATLNAGDSVTIGAYIQGDDSGREYHSGTATITRVNRDGSMDGTGVLSFEFQGNGTLTKATV